jgi:DNA-binding response OmpR family regulator
MARIAIVDDNPANSLPLSRLLRFEGHEVDCILRSDSALARLRERRPDLLLLDVGMPEVDGIELLRMLRQDESLRELPVVMFSGLSDQVLIAEATSLGAKDYLVKGCHWDGMLARIEQHLPRN